jgi:Cu-Zn family superoxide dismutase
MRIVTIGAAAIMALGLSACDKHGTEVGAPIANGAGATASLRTAAGADAGRASAREVAGGLRFTIDAKGLPPGTHGAHVHMTGACAPARLCERGRALESDCMKHGSMNPAGPHEGDLPNLIVGTDGRGTIGITIPGATLAGLLDADGSAIVVHAAADDLMTDPSGNSGARIACGVFAAG